MSRFSAALMAAVSVIGFTQIALAADMPTKAPLVPAVAAPSWTGWYLGLNAGGGWENTIYNSVTSTSCFTPPIAPAACAPIGNSFAAALTGQLNTRPHGFIGGGQIGYNYQTGAVVWGVEADFQGTGIKGSASAAANSVPIVGFVNNAVNAASTGSQKIDWFGTVRGRVGWLPTNPLLLYVTGGLAYGHVQTDVSFSENISLSPTSGATSAADSATRAGWTVGGGMEWMLASHWSVKGEYLYYDLGNVTLNSTLNTFDNLHILGNAIGIQSVARYHGNIARIGVNYKF
jgi:outer membrane immunogenic protein